jgi:hypothetical protein
MTIFKTKAPNILDLKLKNIQIEFLNSFSRNNFEILIDKSEYIDLLNMLIGNINREIFAATEQGSSWLEFSEKSSIYNYIFYPEEASVIRESILIAAVSYDTAHGYEVNVNTKNLYLKIEWS